MKLLCPESFYSYKQVAKDSIVCLFVHLAIIQLVHLTNSTVDINIELLTILLSHVLKCKSY